MAESCPLGRLIECSLLGGDNKVLGRGEYLNVYKPYYGLIKFLSEYKPSPIPIQKMDFPAQTKEDPLILN